MDYAFLKIQMQSSFLWDPTIPDHANQNQIKIMQLCWPCWKLDSGPIEIFSKETWSEKPIAKCWAGESCEQRGVSQQGGSNFLFISPLKIILIEHHPRWTSLSFLLLAPKNMPIKQKELHLFFENSSHWTSSTLNIFLENHPRLATLLLNWNSICRGSDDGQLDYSSLSCCSAPGDFHFNHNESKQIKEQQFRDPSTTLVFFFSIKGKGCRRRAG